MVQVPQGSLYPTLHRLENCGYLRTEWRATESGREAKFYSLTPKGEKQLQAATGGFILGRPGSVLSRSV